jgi:hypothetical protein
MRIALAFIGVCVTVVGGVIFLRSHSVQGKPELAESDAIESAWTRFSARRNEDGSLPGDDALMNAIQQRKDMLGANHHRLAGIFPGSWTWLGPGNIGGRIRAIVVKPGDPNTMWLGATSGGIWKTTDGGTTWQPMDDFMPTLAVSSMVLSPSDSNTLLAGTGEGFFETAYGSSNKSAIQGAGVFRSRDGGITWSQIPSTANSNWVSVNRLAYQPGNSNVVLAATGTGIYRSTDGGDNWTLVNPTETYDIDFDPSNGQNAVAGTRGIGALYSTDGGQTWNQATGMTGVRTEVAYAPSNTSIVYATLSTTGSVNNDNLNVYRSTDGGHTFVLRGASTVTTYSAYNVALWVNPTNSDNILYGGVNLYRSTDGGNTRSQAFTGVHSDMHAIVSSPAFDGSTNRVVFVGCDGGIYKIPDTSGSSSSSLNHNLGITQFYGAVMNPISGVVMGGAQDNGTLRYAGNVQGWTASFGGDGGYAATDATNSSYFYGESQHGDIFRSTNGGTSGSYIYSGITDANADTTNFATYFTLDPNNQSRMLVGCRQLWRTNNVKASTVSWSVIKSSIGNGAVGGIGNDHFIEDDPRNISTVAIAPSNSDVIYVGYNSGQIWRTTNGTATTPTWTRIDDLAGPLPLRWVSGFAIDPTNPDHVYVAFQGWTSDNVWESTDGGANWHLITGTGLTGLPSAPASAIAVHPTRPGWLYVGTDIGLFTSVDNGQNWSPTTDGPAAVCVQELHFMSPTSLVAVTYGRGVYQATLNLNQETVTPYAYSFFRGFSVSGKVSDLWISDDKRVIGQAGITLSGTEAPVQLILNGISPYSSATDLKIDVESGVTASGLVQSVELYDFTANAYVQVDSRTATTSDSAIEVTAPSPNRFIQAGSRAMRARIGLRAPGPVSNYPWRGQFDQVVWKVTP